MPEKQIDISSFLLNSELTSLGGDMELYLALSWQLMSDIVSSENLDKLLLQNDDCKNKVREGVGRVRNRKGNDLQIGDKWKDILQQQILELMRSISMCADPIDEVQMKVKENWLEELLHGADNFQNEEFGDITKDEDDKKRKEERTETLLQIYEKLTKKLIIELNPSKRVQINSRLNEIELMVK